MNIFSADFWDSQTNLKSKSYIYRVQRNLKVKVVEVNADTPVSEIARILNGKPHGVIHTEEGKLRAKELAMEDFFNQMVLLADKN